MDISIGIEPLDVAWAKLQLDTRRNALESSPLTPARAVALEQIGELRMAYERRSTLPMRMAISLSVRAESHPALEKISNRVRQRVKDLSAELHLLKWEQRAGWLATIHPDEWADASALWHAAMRTGERYSQRIRLRWASADA